MTSRSEQRLQLVRRRARYLQDWGGVDELVAQ